MLLPLLVLMLSIDATPQHAPATPPLDDRIDASRITEYDPPSLPEQVVLPMPPTFVLAASASDVPIDEARFAMAMDAMRRGTDALAALRVPGSGWSPGATTAPTDTEEVSPVAVAISALAVKALAQADPNALEREELVEAVRFIRSVRTDDGAFEGGALTNYVTSTVVMALASLDRAEFARDVQGGVQWLTTAQWDDGEGLSPRQDWYGGAGYGTRGRPDLSNTQMMIDALYQARTSPDEPSLERARAFLARCQNLKSTNAAEWAGDDGGFVYTPANGGESMASEVAGEGRSGELIPEGAPRSLRSYGSMTYAGFKSMMYAGLSTNDVRVRAAFDWIRNHWTFDENPGMGQQGLYYYYHVMSRALAIGQQHHVTDANGIRHNWREELIDALVARQRDDGSWINEADRWMEGEPELATAFAVLALQEALKPALMLQDQGQDQGQDQEEWRKPMRIPTPNAVP